MSGYVVVIGPCVACGRIIGYHPNKAPSLVVDGEPRALCEACFNRWNEIHRLSQGLPPEPLDPEAYEPCPGEQL